MVKEITHGHMGKSLKFLLQLLKLLLIKLIVLLLPEEVE